MKLSKIIEVIDDKCVNCHQCISVCPSKYANDGSDDIIHMNHDLCIGCGQCVKACSHDARVIVDDFNAAITALNKKEKIVAIVAPAVAASFPDNYLRLNAWLKSLGAEAIFDVSFGAELTVKSYLEHVGQNPDKTVISQPCPAIVTYIQIHQPDLIDYLAPAHSPMLHAAVMIKEYYPKYKNHKILVVSPCTAKKREFIETGIGDFNVTIASIEGYLKENNVDLSSFNELEFDNDPAERATLFSTPGGLMETAEREVPGIRHRIRKVEGPSLIYNYMEHLHESIEKGIAPAIVDCLNCDAGCNGGTGTTLTNASHDEIDSHIKKRVEKHINKYSSKKTNGSLKKTINKYWKPEIYNRSYLNLHENFTTSVTTPNSEELEGIYHSMHKNSDEDLFNCSSCGYNTCEGMAIAIHNNLNKKENCFHYNQKVVETENINLDIKIKDSEKKILDSKNELIDQSEQLLDFLSNIKTLIK